MTVPALENRGKIDGRCRHMQGNHGGLPLRSIAYPSVMPWDFHHCRVGAGPRACPDRFAPVFVLASVPVSPRFPDPWKRQGRRDGGHGQNAYSVEKPMAVEGTGKPRKNPRPVQARTGQPRGVAPTIHCVPIGHAVGFPPLPCRGRPPCLPCSRRPDLRFTPVFRSMETAVAARRRTRGKRIFGGKTGGR